MLGRSLSRPHFDAPAGQGDSLPGLPRPQVEKPSNMSSPPRFSERKPASAPARPIAEPETIAAKLPPLSDRLPKMSETQLRAYRASAQRVGKDAAHPKCAAALKALPLIDAEIGRRAMRGAALAPNDESDA